uniref:SWIM-type domain-containing protein n=1 Tax=Trichobilharzia regenti TaxID=157069 RepID=A0AA85JUS6_TRIRE|nr:unnamed protein product [Trichobilharzia regenti]
MTLSEEDIFTRIMISRPLREWNDVETALYWVEQATCMTYMRSDFQILDNTEERTIYKFANYKCSCSMKLVYNSNVNSISDFIEDCDAGFQIKWIGDRYVVAKFNLKHNHTRPLYPGGTILMKESITAEKEREQSSSNESNSLTIQDQLAQSNNNKTSDEVICSVTQTRYEAIETYRLYPEVVVLSATHNATTTRKASVFQFIVIDGFGYAKPIMYCMSTIQQQDVLSTFLKHFSLIPQNVNKTRTFIMDCAFNRKCKNPTAIAYFRAMITTQSRLQFDYFIERLQCTDVDAYNYVMNRWMPMKSNWAVSFYSDDVITLGVNVIDIIKSVNPSIKESLKNLTDIKDCLTVLHNEAEKHWISPNRINLPLTHLTKNEESNDNNNNKIVIPEKLKSIFNQLTDYAADMMYNHSIRMNEIHVDFINSGIALCKDGYFQYEVNRNESTCSCAFNVSSFLPCEHLCLIYLRYGLYKEYYLKEENTKFSKDRDPFGDFILKSSCTIAFI